MERVSRIRNRLTGCSIVRPHDVCFLLPPRGQGRWGKVEATNKRTTRTTTTASDNKPDRETRGIFLIEIDLCERNASPTRRLYDFAALSNEDSKISPRIEEAAWQTYLYSLGCFEALSFSFYQRPFPFLSLSLCLPLRTDNQCDQMLE